MTWSLASKRIVVTGASKGIGAAVVHTLVERGAEVLAIARGAEALSALAESAGCAVLAADVVDSETVVRAVTDRWDGLDGLVNNAGINIRKDFVHTERADFSRILDVNLRAPFELCQGLHPLLAARRGAVVNVSSVASEHAIRTSTASYAASKGGLDALTRFLAATWGADGIRVNGVAPWYVRTPLAEAVLSDRAKRESILARTPLGRLGEPEDVAAAVAWLLMPASSWVTGTIVPVDGGFSVLGS